MRPIKNPANETIVVRLNDGKVITVALPTGNRLVRKGRATRVETAMVRPDNAMLQRGETR
jgi:hypothetical protein